MIARNLGKILIDEGYNVQYNQPVASVKLTQKADPTGQISEGWMKKPYCLS